MKISQSKFAQQIGVSQQQIGKYISSGILKKINDKGEIDSEESIKTLKGLGKIGDDGKYIKRENITQDNGSLLPFDGDVSYKSPANMTEEEIEEVERKEREEAQRAVDALKNKAQILGASLSDEQQNFLDKAELSESRRKREAADAMTAELNIKLKEIEIARKQREDEITEGLYILKSEVKVQASEAGSAFVNAAMISIDRSAPQLIGKQSIHEIKSILKDQLAISLKGLINE